MEEIGHKTDQDADRRKILNKFRRSNKKVMILLDGGLFWTKHCSYVFRRAAYVLTKPVIVTFRSKTVHCVTSRTDERKTRWKRISFRSSLLL